MKIQPVLRFAFVLFAASIWVLPASGSCNPPKSVSTYNFLTGAYAYWHTSLSAASALNATIWSDVGDHTGTCNQSSGILYFGATPGDVGINLSLGDACVTGCPVGSLSILASAANFQRSETLVARTIETPGGAVNFDFSQTGSRVLGEYPRPRVTSSSRDGNQILLSLAIPALTAVFDGAESGIAGYNILSVEAPTDPGRFAGAYALRSFLPAPGGTGATGSVAGNCPVDFHNDVWMVTQIVTVAGASQMVSEALRIRCQIFAEPTRKIDRRMTTGTEN